MLDLRRTSRTSCRKLLAHRQNPMDFKLTISTVVIFLFNHLDRLFSNVFFWTITIADGHRSNDAMASTTSNQYNSQNLELIFKTDFVQVDEAAWRGIE